MVLKFLISTLALASWLLVSGSARALGRRPGPVLGDVGRLAHAVRAVPRGRSVGGVGGRRGRAAMEQRLLLLGLAVHFHVFFQSRWAIGRLPNLTDGIQANHTRTATARAREWRLRGHLQLRLTCKRMLKACLFRARVVAWWGGVRCGGQRGRAARETQVRVQRVVCVGGRVRAPRVHCLRKGACGTRTGMHTLHIRQLKCTRKRVPGA
mmetsp:Transcript_51192/g.128441  ORF Transcript_51192/g.128441 Transcript_51192/m.128441 type:complete len:209 (-) Transcript_51192:572-1198(-)